MERLAQGPWEDVEELARAFLAALDEERWSDAANLVDPATREAFQVWLVDQIRSSEGADPSEAQTDTQFLSAATLIGISSAAEAARFTSTEIVARFAQAVSPDSVNRLSGVRGSGGAPRMTRHFLEVVSSTHGRATVRYRAEWWEGSELSRAMGGIHSLELILTEHGWRIRDADLGGWGVGHILPPSE